MRNATDPQSSRNGARRYLAAGTVALLATLAVAGPVGAQAQLSPDLFKAWQWRSIGPVLGGRSIAAAGSRSRPLEYYFGATGGGLWKTTDGGTTWAPVTDGNLESSSVGSIGICEANPDIVYVGMGEGQWRAQMNTGDGAYGTRDGGQTWTHLGLASSTGQTAITRMRVHPTDCDLVYAAVLGDPYGPNPERGVFRSGDGGRTWEQILFRDEQTGASDLSMDPNDPRVLYATLWDAVRPPWGGIDGPASGLFKSTDGGDTWTELTRNPGLPQGKIGKSAIAVSGADPQRIYALITADPDSAGLFVSSDAGATWERVNGDNTMVHRSEYYVRVYADPTIRDRVYVLNRGFYRSDDGGRTSSSIRVPHGDNHDLWIAPDDPDRMINANDGGANVSFNGGQTWTEQDYPTAQIYHIIVTDDFPYVVCGAQQDNTSKCLPSDGDGRFWYRGSGGEQGYVAQHPTQTTLGWGGSQRGGLVRFDRATGQRQAVDVWPDMSDGEVSDQLQERFQWTYPIVLSPHDPNLLYTSSQHLWKTTNGGHSWEKISPDLTRHEPRTLVGSKQLVNDHSGTDYYATIFTVAPSPHDPNTIWTGSDDGLIQLTRDGGKSWQDVTPRELPEFAKVSLVTVSPHSPAKAYAAVEKYKLQDIAPYIFRTEDYGQTWTKIVQGIPHGHFVRAVREDPVRPGLLFAGTEHAPYVSFDDGASWIALSLNLPAVQVSDIEIKDNDLIISTFGRGIYILDDISPLRELSSEALAAPVRLFTPRDVVRTRGGTKDGIAYTRTVLPSANHINVYYHLAEPARQISIEFLDAHGQVVRRFAATPETQPWEPVRNSVGHVLNSTRWGSATPAPPIQLDAGLHGFSWDLRHEPAADFVGLRLRDTNVDGPVVVPGEYRVRLAVDGQAQESSFRVGIDPRLGGTVTQEDYEAQLRFCLEVHGRLNDATSAVGLIRDLKQQIDERMGRTSEASVSRAGETLEEHLSAVEGEIYQVRIGTESDIKHFGPQLTNKLAGVYAVAQSADARPTAQAERVFEELSRRLDVQLARLDEILGAELTGFNDLLRQHDLPPVEVRAAPWAISDDA